MEREEKAKVVAAVWRADFVQFLAALAILPRSVWKKRLNSFVRSPFTDKYLQAVCEEIAMIYSTAVWLVLRQYTLYHKCTVTNKVRKQVGFLKHNKKYNFSFTSYVLYTVCSIFVKPDLYIFPTGNNWCQIRISAHSV